MVVKNTVQLANSKILLSVDSEGQFSWYRQESDDLTSISELDACMYGITSPYSCGHFLLCMYACTIMYVCTIWFINYHDIYYHFCI